MKLPLRPNRLERRSGPAWFILVRGDEFDGWHCGVKFRRTNRTTDGGWPVWEEV